MKDRSPVEKIEFISKVTDLKLGVVDFEKIANYLEAIIRNDTYSYPESEQPDAPTITTDHQYFTTAMATSVRAAKMADNTYEINATDPDIIKYCKAFINLVRALKSINRDIVKPYIQHLVTKENKTWTDTNLLRMGFRLAIDTYFSSGEQFIRLHKHFVAFQYYAIECSNAIFQYPFIIKKYHSALTFLSAAYDKSNIKKGVELARASQSKLNEKQNRILEEGKIPQIDSNPLLQVFNSFGLRTHLDTLTEMAASINLRNKKYYDESSDKYIYGLATVSEQGRREMDLYNGCNGARLSMLRARASLLSILNTHAMASASDASENNMKVDQPWSTLSEATRTEYIKFNETMCELNNHIAKIKPLLDKEPQLAKIITEDTKRVKQHIKFLQAWDTSEARKSIDILKGALTLNTLLSWTKDYTLSQLSDIEKHQHLDSDTDLFTTTSDLDERTHNMMLIYNINSRLENAYRRQQRLREESFSLGLIPEACRLLFEIGHIISDYRQLRGTEFIESAKLLIQDDLNLLLSEFSDLFLEFVYAAQLLESTQGLATGIFIEPLQNVFGAYLYLLTCNNDLPQQYKLEINTSLFSEESLINMQNHAKQKATEVNQQQVHKAIEAKAALHRYSPRDGSVELMPLIYLLAQMKNLDTYKAKQHRQYLQMVINKLVGLDELDAIIAQEENAIKAIIGDNIVQLEKFASDDEIKKRRIIISELYRIQARIKDMLISLETHKDNLAALNKIEVCHFIVLDYTPRLKNYLWTWAGYDATSIYQLLPGTRENIDFHALAEGLDEYHELLLTELNAIIATHGPATAAIEEDHHTRKAVVPKTQTALIEEALQSNTSLLGHILHSRKGHAVLLVEDLRHRLVKSATGYLHADTREYLGMAYLQQNDTFHIRKHDTLAIVNIKALHNAVARLERLLELLNRIAEIPTEGKIAKTMLTTRVTGQLPELKLRLNDFFDELETVIETISTLYHCMKNNTLNIFEQDVLNETIKLLNYGKAAIAYCYTHFGADNPLKQKHTLEAGIDTVLCWLMSFSTNSDKVNSFDYLKEITGYFEPVNQSDGISTVTDNDAKIIIRQAIKKAGDAIRHLSNAAEIANHLQSNHPAQTEKQLIIFLKQFVENAGRIHKHYDGSYDIDRLPDGSLQKCIAAFLNVKDNINSFMDSTVSMVNGHTIIGFLKSMHHLLRIKRQMDKSQLLDVFQDGLQQYDFNKHVVTREINALIDQSVAYLHPKIIDFVAQARIAETILGLSDGIIVGKLKQWLDSFININDSIITDKFNDLNDDFPYDTQTLTLAKSELARLNELEKTNKSGHHYYGNAANSLSELCKSLQKSLVRSSRSPKSSPAIAATKTTSTPVLIAPPVQIVQPEYFSLNDNNAPSPIPLLKPTPVDVTDRHLWSEDERDISDTLYELDGADSDTQSLNTPLLESNRPEEANPNLENLEREKVIQLSLACSQYKHYLARKINELREKDHPELGRYFSLSKPHPKINDASVPLKLAIEKFNTVLDLQRTLEDDTNPHQKLKAFRHALTPACRYRLEQSRDSAAVTFLKVLASIFSLGLAVAFGIWQSSGTTLVRQFDYINPPKKPSYC